MLGFGYAFGFGAGSKMHRFSISKIARASSDDVLVPLNSSKHTFFGFYDRTFCVLPDSSTVLGCSGKDLTHLIMEKLGRDNSFVRVAKHKAYITSVCMNRKGTNFLVGLQSGDIFQYKLTNNAIHLQREYESIGANGALAISLVGNLAVVGGIGGKMVLIDTHRKSVLKNLIVKTAAGHIFTAQICPVESNPGAKALDSESDPNPNSQQSEASRARHSPKSTMSFVGGYEYDFFDNLTDVFMMQNKNADSGGKDRAQGGPNQPREAPTSTALRALQRRLAESQRELQKTERVHDVNVDQLTVSRAGLRVDFASEVTHRPLLEPR